MPKNLKRTVRTQAAAARAAHELRARAVQYERAANHGVLPQAELNEENMGRNATYEQAVEMCRQMRALGWDVIYGSMPWPFRTDAARVAFEADLGALE